LTLEERLSHLEQFARARAEDLAARQARRSVLQEQLADLDTRVTTAKQAAEELVQARVLFENLTDSKRELVRSKIEALVTYGIQAVFGPDYSFSIEQKLARNQVTFEYRVHQTFGSDVRVTELRGAHGGGLVSLIGFLLRMVMVLFVHPPRRRIMFLDETFANLDADKRPALAKLLQSLGASLNVQFVMITHSPEYVDEADMVYEIRRRGDASVLTKVN
jgi:DNA repair exonuclease SbcCD ATPase subunit